ncbi:Venom prothrombin activator oscutarin-C non-catalytic subunit [Exaiptasia diaphana]|nr:Venom prothrombin activator oscutarin-C non-catalytic subunit [Exaiptasia diaphana]
MGNISRVGWKAKREDNKDRSTIVTNHIKYPFKAKFVRVVPGKTYSNMMSLRVDFKGTAEACTVPLGVENNGISDSQMTSSSSLDISHAASRGRLYGNCYTPRINTLSTLFTTKLPTERTTEKGNCYTPRINTLSTLFTTKLPTERTTEKGMNIVVPAESSSTVPMVIAVIALGALVGFSLTTNVFLAYKLYKNKKGFQISSSPDGQPTHSLDNHVTNEGFIQEERATTNDEINQSTQETGEYMEPIDNNIATRPMTMPNTEANSTYMPLKPKEQAIYQPLLRNGNKMGNERKEGKKPTEYLEILPEEDLTAPYEDMSTNV